MKKKIIITGGLGYIGTELCKLYSGYSWHHEIIVIDNRFISERVNQIRKWNMEFVEIMAEIRDRSSSSTGLVSTMFPAVPIWCPSLVWLLPRQAFKQQLKIQTNRTKASPSSSKRILTVAGCSMNTVFTTLPSMMNFPFFRGAPREMQ